jgi:hypothetical protein
MMKSVLLFFYFISVLLVHIQSNSVYVENFGLDKAKSFKLSNSLSSSLLKSAYFHHPGNLIRCLSHCSELANCLTVEITYASTLNADQIRQCAFYSIIPLFNSTDVISSTSNKIYVKKLDQALGFNQSCVYDNCPQEMGLTCISGSCLCRDPNR